MAKIAMESVDPFSPLAFGARPSLACYWPDTRFVELQTDSGYFEKLLGRRPRSRDRTVLSLAASVLHHERVHWQVAHSLSWGLQRSALISMKTTLASLFFRSLTSDELRAVFAARAKGVVPIARTADHDLHVGEDWSGYQHTTAEHAWLCSGLTSLIDRDYAPFARVRPPEFTLGVVSQYLAQGIDPCDVVEGDDREFGERAATFKRWKTRENVWEVQKLAVRSVEECLALIGQLNYVKGQTANARRTKSMVERFQQDIVTGVFGDAGHLYSACFKAAQAAFGCGFDELDLSLLALICELALDPPLPFDGEGCAEVGDWASFHPSLRFGRLLDAASRIDWTRHGPLHDRDGADIAKVATQLLADAGLERARSERLGEWLRGYDDDNTQWPSQELAWQHARTSIEGREMLDAYPGLLFDASRYAAHKSPSTFFDLPYVVINGQTHVLERDDELKFREAGRQTFNAHIARATDNFAFQKKKLQVEGLPTKGGFSVFPQRLHEFFSAAWSVELEPLALA